MVQEKKEKQEGKNPFVNLSAGTSFTLKNCINLLFPKKTCLSD